MEIPTWTTYDAVTGLQKKRFAPMETFLIDGWITPSVDTVGTTIVIDNYGTSGAFIDTPMNAVHNFSAAAGPILLSTINGAPITASAGADGRSLWISISGLNPSLGTMVVYYETYPKTKTFKDCKITDGKVE